MSKERFGALFHWGNPVHFVTRLRAAAKFAGIHLVGSVALALMCAGLVFSIWYPSVFASLAGGRELFILVVAVDVVCGPLLTLVLYNPAKPRTELVRDLGFVVLIQLAALGYGLHTVWLARPLYLVLETDRFRVIAAPDLGMRELHDLPKEMQPQFFGGPMTIGLRLPKDETERMTVLFDSVAGGRDYAQRPEFFVPYTPEVGLRAVSRFKPLERFLNVHPEQRKKAEDVAMTSGLQVSTLRYLPVAGREDWIALLDTQAQIVGFLKGDGFIN
jgi:hypothetical protein